MRPLNVIIPFTIDSCFGVPGEFTLEELSVLETTGINRLKMVEYTFALWGVHTEFLREGRRDWGYDQMVCDLADDLFPRGVNHASEQAQQMFAHSADALYRVLLKLMAKFEPYIGTLADGIPNRPVETITIHPYGRDAMVVAMYLLTPEEIAMQGFRPPLAA